MNDVISVLLAGLGGYLLGAIPFGLVLTRMVGLGDIRSVGSGNIGATNVLRTGRKDLALATLLLDAGKGGIVFQCLDQIGTRPYSRFDGRGRGVAVLTNPFMHLLPIRSPSDGGHQQILRGHVGQRLFDVPSNDRRMHFQPLGEIQSQPQYSIGGQERLRQIQPSRGTVVEGAFQPLSRGGLGGD